MTKLLTILCLIVTITLASSSKLNLQNFEDGDIFDCKANYMKLSSRFDSLADDSRELMRELRGVMRENKDILLRLTNIENSLIKAEDFNNLKKEMFDIKAVVGFTSTQNLLTKIESFEETTNELTKALAFLKNSQTKLEIKTVQLDANLKDFKTKQEMKMTEFINDSKLDKEEFKVSSNKLLESMKSETNQSLVNQINNINSFKNDYAMKSEVPQIVHAWLTSLRKDKTIRMVDSLNKVYSKLDFGNFRVNIE